VVFDSLSNATAYTATVNAVTGGIRTKALTIAGPLTGNLTLAGSTAIVGIHGDVTLPATGLTRTYTGDITLSSSSIGRTLTTNGVSLASQIIISGQGSEWSLGSALNGSNGAFNVFIGSFNTANYNITAAQFTLGVNISTNIATTASTATLGSSTITLSNSNPFNVGFRFDASFNSGTSQFNITAAAPTVLGSGYTFYNVAFTSTSAGTVTLNGANTFNDLSFTGITAAGLKVVSLTANQTITGTLTLSAGTDATMRHFVRSDTIGTTRTLTCAAFSGTDADFRDITIAGAAAPVSGTRLGDCKGNSGITFGAGATKYWNLAGSNNWSATGWATGSGGVPDINNFPLAQDTAVFESTSPGTGTTTTINAAYNIGTIDMSARTSNTMTLATGSTTPAIYGNWINGTGTTLTGTGTMTFAGRGSQTITSAGRTFTQGFNVNTPSGSVTLQDALISTSAIILTAGTFDANDYNIATTRFESNTTSTRTVKIGSGTWTLSAAGAASTTAPWVASSGFSTVASGLTVIPSTGTISLTSATNQKDFFGGGLTYPTINQAGAGSIRLGGNNTFANITKTFAGASIIQIGIPATSSATVNAFTASGSAGNLLTLSSTTAGTPAILILTSGVVSTVDYLAISDIRAYSVSSTWYAGANSTNNGSLGWYFESGAVSITATISETSTATDAVSAVLTYISSLSETSTATDTVDAPGSTFNPSLSEAATATDAVAGTLTLLAQVADALTGTDTVSVTLTISPSVSETATATDEVSSKFLFAGIILESATATDATSTTGTFNPSLAETATATDSDSVTSTFNPSVSESAAGADTASAVYTSNPSVSETATGTDVVSPQYNANPSVAESATITDAVSPKYNANPSVAETATATDSDSATAVFTPSLSETATATDAPSTANNTFNPSLAETATGTDIPVANLSVTGAVSETATATDTTQSVVVFVGAVSETVTATDLISALTNFLGQIAETATATDITLVAPSVFGPQVQEAVAALDATRPINSTFNVQLVESATALDSVIGAYLWNVIDDDQTPNWVNISNPQNPGWSAIDDSQNPNWQNVDT
jgi:hypothetical protein